jgi:hypothetical protein
LKKRFITFLFLILVFPFFVRAAERDSVSLRCLKIAGKVFLTVVVFEGLVAIDRLYDRWRGLRLADGESEDRFCSELGKWAQTKMGISEIWQLPVVVGECHYTGGGILIGGVSSTKILLDPYQFVMAPLSLQRVAILHEARHVAQRRFAVVFLILNLLGRVEKDADLQAARMSGCWKCVESFALGRSFDRGAEWNPYATRGDLEPIFEKQKRAGLLCSMHRKIESIKKRFPFSVYPLSPLLIFNYMDFSSIISKTAELETKREFLEGKREGF